MVLLTLPWTDSEYTQLKGRIYRQGSNFGEVEFIIPQVKIELEENEFWSWDIERLNLIKNKRTLADAAVDGLIPSKILPSAKTMYSKSIESLEKWKQRINDGNLIENNRNLTQIDLYPNIIDVKERQQRINSELSEFNRMGKTTKSSTMNKKFNDDPESWHLYHRLRRESMKDWGEIPYKEIAKNILCETDVVIDFGCGDNQFKLEIPNNKVTSVDHVACDDSVIACDMADLSKYVENESHDVAVFSLSLWGTNYKEYISEAYRVLRRKGFIYIAEPTKNYETVEEQNTLKELVIEAGFKVVGNLDIREKFIYITGIKI